MHLKQTLLKAVVLREVDKGSKDRKFQWFLLDKLLSFLQKSFFQLLIFLMPTQLSLHFWPAWAHVFAIRVDYLAPVIYFTDLLVLTLFLLVILKELIKPKINQNSSLEKPGLYKLLLILILFLLILSNIYLANNPQTAIIKWTKAAEFALLILYIKNVRKLKFNSWVVKPLIYSLIFFSLISFIQFYLQRTIGGLFYFLGERSFSSSTPGIALVDLFGRQFMRAYSTFSHPNSLAGFYVAGLWLVLRNNFDNRKRFWEGEFIILVSLLVLLVSFSFGAWLAMLVASCMYFLRKNKSLFNKLTKLIFWSTIIASLLLPIIYKTMFYPPSQKTVSVSSGMNAKKFPLRRDFAPDEAQGEDTLGVSPRELHNLNIFSQSVAQRLELTEVAAKLFSVNPVFGVGLNNFITYLPKVATRPEVSWWLQPVHNIFLLVLVEAGMIGFLAFVLLVNYALNNLLELQRYNLTLALVVILLTGFVDHYWLTLQQNLLLVSIVLGLSFRKKLG